MTRQRLTQILRDHVTRHGTTRPACVPLAVGLAVLMACLMGAVAAAPTATAGPYAWPTVTFLPHATVRANGAGAIVQLSVACTGLKITYLEVGVFAARPDGTIGGAGGYAILTRDCTPQPQLVTAPLEADNLALENSSVPGDQGPLPAGHATTVAYADCLGFSCRSQYYPPQSVTLVNSADLDRLSDAMTTIDPHPSLRANGAAADVHFTSRCSTSFIAGGTELHQNNSTRVVQNATSVVSTTVPCTSPTVGYHVRVYPNLSVSTAPLHTGTAFVVDDGTSASPQELFGQVTVR